MWLVRLAGDIGVFTGAIAATLFVIGYQVTARWRESAEGWHLMAFTAAMALIMDYSAVRVMFGALPHVPPDVAVVRAVVFDVIGVLLVWRLLLLYRLQLTRVLERLRDRRGDL